MAAVSDGCLLLVVAAVSDGCLLLVVAAVSDGCLLLVVAAVMSSGGPKRVRQDSFFPTINEIKSRSYQSTYQKKNRKYLK